MTPQTIDFAFYSNISHKCVDFSQDQLSWFFSSKSAVKTSILRRANRLCSAITRGEIPPKYAQMSPQMHNAFLNREEEIRSDERNSYSLISKLGLIQKLSFSRINTEDKLTELICKLRKETTANNLQSREAKCNPGNPDNPGTDDR